MTAKMVLSRKRRKRLEAGHPWIYRTEIERMDDGISPGDVVHVHNHQGVFLATAYANPASQITARVLSYRDEPIDGEFFLKRVKDAWAYRRRFVDNLQACRAIYGEADFLPGLTVDKYDDILVVQILSYGMEVQKPRLLEALLQVFEPRGIYLRNDVSVRQLEGLPLETGVWYGEVPRSIEIEENGLRFLVDVYEGQKTGYFFDQRENRASIAPLMTGWKEHRRHDDSSAQNDVEPANQSARADLDGAEVLECFCHTGSFTMHALHYGAAHVTAVDISEHAIEVAKQNAELNQVTNRVEFIVANAFDYLREVERSGKQFDVVILDPPAFAKSRHAVEGACRGYKDINLRGLKLVRDGGYLVTASCSYHMLPDLFRDTILDAAFDARKVLRLVHWAGAGKDHPEIAGVEEGHYLKFAIYEVYSRA